MTSPSVVDRFMGNVFPEPMSGCWIWDACIDRLGYGRFMVKKYGEVLAHRVSYILFKTQIPKGLYVLHKCDVRCCVNPDHLFLGTQADNVQDMVNKGRAKGYSAPGEKHYRAKLTTAIVQKIKKSTCSQKEMANKYGVTQSHISYLKSGKRWRHLNG